MGRNKSLLGGLIGDAGYSPSGTEPNVEPSCGTGTVSGPGTPGGLVGAVGFAGTSFANAYWDTSTSEITNPGQGAGNVGSDPGITGLTTTQLQAGLPAGFNTTVWGESPGINGGLPYLLALPPPA